MWVRTSDGNGFFQVTNVFYDWTRYGYNICGNVIGKVSDSSYWREIYCGECWSCNYSEHECNRNVHLGNPDPDRFDDDCLGIDDTAVILGFYKYKFEIDYELQRIQHHLACAQNKFYVMSPKISDQYLKQLANSKGIIFVEELYTTMVISQTQKKQRDFSKVMFGYSGKSEVELKGKKFRIDGYKFQKVFREDGLEMKPRNGFITFTELETLKNNLFFRVD